MAINPNRPAGTPPATDTAIAPATPAPAAPRSVQVTDSDALIVRVKQGDTLFQMARLFAEDQNRDGSITGKELTGFVARIKKANGGNPAMAIDQPLKIPHRQANGPVQLAIAVQKFIEKYPDAGMGKVEDYDWQHVDLGGAPSGWSGVIVAGKDGFNKHFLVSDGMVDGDDTATDPNTYVMTMEAFQKHFDL